MIHWSNTAGSLDTPLGPGPAGPAVAPAPERAPFAIARREGALTTARRFLRTAVVREHVEDSWHLVAPSLREGYTKKTWATQDIPVQPYPVDAAKWGVQYSWEDTVMLRVALFPRHGVDVPAAVFDMQLRAFGKGDRRRWLVDSWTPASYTGVPSGPLGTSARNPAPPPKAEGELGAGWLALPLGILALVLVVPIGFGILGWRRDRRAVRRYEAGLR
jgi:hypothetical protein